MGKKIQNCIILGSDHAGYELKEKIKEFLNESGYEVTDAGVHSTESADYPKIAQIVATSVKEKKYDKGILICGTGVGMSIAANKIPQIRAVVCSDISTAKLSVMHNDTNILCLGARIIGEYTAKDICLAWLNSKFEGERHAKRLNLIEPYPDLF